MCSRSFEDTRRLNGVGAAIFFAERRVSINCFSRISTLTGWPMRKLARLVSGLRKHERHFAPLLGALGITRPVYIQAIAVSDADGERALFHGGLFVKSLTFGCGSSTYRVSTLRVCGRRTNRKRSIESRGTRRNVDVQTWR